VIALLSCIGRSLRCAEALIYICDDDYGGPVPSVEWIGRRHGKIKSCELNFTVCEEAGNQRGSPRTSEGLATATPDPALVAVRFRHGAGCAIGHWAAASHNMCQSAARLLRMLGFAPASVIMGSNFVGANSTVGDPSPYLSFPSAPNRMEWVLARSEGGPTGRRSEGKEGIQADIH